MNRVSYFQHQLDLAAEVEDEVYFNAFYAIYWLAKHCIANKQVNSLVMLLEHLGCEVKAFQHRSPGSVREINQLIAKTIIAKTKLLIKCNHLPPLESSWMT